jgi:DNA-binding transcriptional LysR family regulator
MSDIHRSLGALDLNLFRVFDVVYRERNLRRAAAALAVTQSAVSHALARLRAQLDDPLFARQGRGLAPTALAAALAPSVREALHGLGRALERRRDFDPRRDLQRVTLALPGEVEAMLLPPLYARLQAAAPEVTLTLARLDRQRLRADLAAGRCDLALDVAHPAEPGVEHERVADIRFCVVAARTRRRLDRAGYLAGAHVAVSSRRTGPTLEDAQFGPDVERRVVVRCQRYETACLLVAQSELLLTMPRWQAELRARWLPLRLFEPPVRIPNVQLHLYGLAQASQGPAQRWLQGQLRALFADVARARSTTTGACAPPTRRR